jgi:hypothetical protein
MMSQRDFAAIDTYHAFMHQTIARRHRAAADNLQQVRVAMVAVLKFAISQ